MAICPFAVQQIIPESRTQGRIVPTTLIYHRAVSSAESLQNYWNTPGVELESHFYIGQFGTLYQFMDTEIRADANVDANGFAISVETWDGGNTPDSMPWNPAQVATAKRLAAWVCDTHGVKRAAAQTWNGGGIGGHNWFPYPWAGGPRGCPGTARNAQIRNDIIPYVAAGGGWRDTPVEDDMPLSDADVSRIFWGTRFDGNDNFAQYLKGNLGAIRAQVAAIAANRDVTPEELDRVTRKAMQDVAREQTPLIVAGLREEITGLVEDALQRVQDADNVDEAKQTVEELLRRLGTLGTTQS